MRNDELVGCLVYIKSAYIIAEKLVSATQGSRFYARGCQYPVTTLCSTNEITLSTIQPKRACASHPLPPDIKKSATPAI